MTATVVQVLQDLFYVLLHVLFYLWSLLKAEPDVQGGQRSKQMGLASGKLTVVPISQIKCAMYKELFVKK